MPSSRRKHGSQRTGGCRRRSNGRCGCTDAGTVYLPQVFRSDLCETLALFGGECGTERISA